jgi:mannose-1-phosphate guanylyltransferase / mannose-6-phosphate isomerase
MPEAFDAPTGSETRSPTDAPWGYFLSVERGDGYQVKRIVVKPGARLSLQTHKHRAEHWVVVSGTAAVTIGSETMKLDENQSVFIPRGEIHRLANPGERQLIVIEVQYGSYLGEDDIERLADDYRRIP